MTIESDSPPIDYYKVLGVPYAATTREITRAYRNAMKLAHPDRAAAGERQFADEQAKLLNLAMRTLTRPAERARYDQSLRKELIQDQIMAQYFGGMGMPGGRDDRYGETLRRQQTALERQERKDTDRGAALSVMLVFAAATALVVCLIIVLALASALVRALP